MMMHLRGITRIIIMKIRNIDKIHFHTLNNLQTQKVTELIVHLINKILNSLVMNILLHLPGIQGTYLLLYTIIMMILMITWIRINIKRLTPAIKHHQIRIYHYLQDQNHLFCLRITKIKTKVQIKNRLTFHWLPEQMQVHLLQIQILILNQLQNNKISQTHYHQKEQLY